MSSPTHQTPNQQVGRLQIPDQHRTQTPNQNPDQYRNGVQTRVQSLLSGTRPRDPHLSSVTTGRLILEGLVEELKIYRLHKEEKAREEKEREKGRNRRMGDHEERERHHHRRHRSRDGSLSCGHEERKHRHRERSRSRERHESRDKGHRERHKSKDRSHGHREHHRRRHLHRDRSRERSRGRSRHHHRRHRHRSPVTDGPRDPNPKLIMSGGAGPPGTVSPVPERRRSRSRSRSRSRRRSSDHRSHSKAQGLRQGPDGKTAFGKFPKKAVGVGVVGHVMNTYRHIKAEHEAGHRDRGVLERAVDGWRGKGGSGRDSGKQRQRGDRRRGEERAGRDRRRIESSERRRGGEKEHDKRNRYTSRDAYKEKELSPRPAASPTRRNSPHPRTRTPDIHVQEATPPDWQQAQQPWPPMPETYLPPTPSHPPPAWPPTPETFVPPSPARSRSATPPYPYTPASPGISPVIPMPSPSSIPPPPPPPLPKSTIPSPPPLPKSAPSSPSHAALCAEIHSAPKLRRVASADKRDKSSAVSAGRVYEETEHSQDIEKREREEEGWGKSEESDEEGQEERIRSIKEHLNRIHG
jgi:hypothetical protein